MPWPTLERPKYDGRIFLPSLPLSASLCQVLNLERRLCWCDNSSGTRGEHFMSAYERAA